MKRRRAELHMAISPYWAREREWVLIPRVAYPQVQGEPEMRGVRRGEFQPSIFVIASNKRILSYFAPFVERGC